ncbi:MAG: tetratricopeptide repeat protein, partial [Candidatus Bathyarchaeota archaeon]|nr:tetratricopeptide repeat protein [Candidatus Termiticorpusculum sp.]
GSVPLCAVVEVGKGRERVDVELEYNGRVEYTHEYAYVILFNRGVEYYKKGNYDLAIEDFNAALRIKPNDYETLRYRGITYRNKGNYDRAIEDFNAALRIKPNDQDALIGRGLAYGLKDNHDRAIEDFNTVLKIKPNDQDALYWRGCVYYNKGNYDKALEDFNAAIRIKPDYQNALYWRGLTYGKKSNYDKAIEDFNTAIKIKPNDQDALLNRGVMYAKKGNHDRAIEDYNAALRIKPDYNIALYSRGYAYYYKGNYDRAIEDLEAILKIDPNDAIARENLEKIRQSKVETKSNIKFFTDNRDGKKYRTVTIGRKTWMAENLNYNVSGSKCYNNNSAYCDKYGRLYDWTMAKVVCPQGWHLPSNAEWQAIVDFAGGNIAGKNLKAKNDWDYGTDIYDFSALPGGYINSRGYFTNAGSTGSWWSSSEFNASNAFNQYIDSSERVIGNYNIKSSLRSVRCVQN